MFSHRSNTSISTYIMLNPKPGSCAIENYLNFFPSYFSMTSVDATLPATPLSQVHSADISSFKSEISHKNDCLTRFFKNHVHTLIFQYEGFFPPLLFQFTCTIRSISLFPPQPANVSTSWGTRPCFLHLKQYMATKKK